MYSFSHASTNSMAWDDWAMEQQNNIMEGWVAGAGHHQGPAHRPQLPHLHVPLEDAQAEIVDLRPQPPVLDADLDQAGLRQVRLEAFARHDPAQGHRGPRAQATVPRAAMATPAVPGSQLAPRQAAPAPSTTRGAAPPPSASARGGGRAASTSHHPSTGGGPRVPAPSIPRTATGSRRSGRLRGHSPPPPPPPPPASSRRSRGRSTRR